MIFGRMALAEAEGAILAHSVRAPSGALKKGRVLGPADIAALAAAGFETVTAARLENGDVPEDEAAAEIAAAACGPGAAASAPFAGRANLYAESAGVALIDPARVEAVNGIDESVTIAALAPYAAVAARRMIATIKIIPFAAPRPAVAAAARAAAADGPLARVAPYTPKTIGLAMSRLPGTRESILDKTLRTVRERAARVGARMLADRRVRHDEAALAEAIAALVADGADIVLVSGASAVVDRRDVVPAAIERADGRVEHFGMPVDPGNLLLLGRLETPRGPVPAIGLPGCARSPKPNGFDWVLERLAANLDVRRADIARMGAGGLLKETPARPQPRNSAAAEPAAAHMPRIAALLLAAGQSRRMGPVNKLVSGIDGEPMVRRAARALLASKAARPLVVTGHEAPRVRAALDGLDVGFVHNPDYADGLSASLRRGLAALDRNCDGALICLGDMPGMRAADIDRAIAAFDPLEGRAIVVPTCRGKRGNPVLWAARFFAQIAAVSGDVGARHLIGENAEWVCEIEVGDRALADIDTADALAAWRAARGA